MTPGRLDVTVQAGAGSQINLDWCQAGDTPTTPGPQVDLTGASGVMNVLSNPGGKNLFSLSSSAPSANGSSITFGSGDYPIQIVLSEADIATMQSGVWTFNVTLNGIIYPLVTGLFTVYLQGQF